MKYLNNPKKYVVLIMVICLSPLFGQSQSWNFKGGVNGSFFNPYDSNGDNIYEEEDSGPDYTSESYTRGIVGYNAAITYEFRFGDMFGLETGLSYSTKGMAIVQDYEYNDTYDTENYTDRAEFRSNVLDVPLLFKIGFGKGILRYYGHLGGYFGFIAFGNVKFIEDYSYEYNPPSGDTQKEEGQYAYRYGVEFDEFDDRFSYGGMVGVGLEFWDFFTEFNYAYGNMGVKDPWDAHRVDSHVIGLSFGYKLRKQTAE